MFILLWFNEIVFKTRRKFRSTSLNLHSTSLNGHSTSLNGHSASMNEDLMLLNIEKQIGAATFSVEHLCL